MSEDRSPVSPADQRVRWDVPAPGVGRVTLARADKRNAQDVKMLRQIDAAFDAAMADEQIKVVILAADGPDFSSGHDLKDPGTGIADSTPEQHMAIEEDIFVGLCWKCRNLPKPTIAQVQGRAIAGGLMLVWPCDLIVASDDATFSDPVVAFGVTGHEYFVHAYEVGQRKAKEMLFSGRALTARECEQLGMVNKVVPRAELESATIWLIETRSPAIWLAAASTSSETRFMNSPAVLGSTNQKRYSRPRANRAAMRSG